MQLRIVQIILYLIVSFIFPSLLKLIGVSMALSHLDLHFTALFHNVANV